MALIDDVRVSLRVVSDATDVEIQMWIDAAIADMRRCGVRDELLDGDPMAPLVKSAVTCFVKGQYGYDNDEAERFMESYKMMLVGLLNSRSNEYLDPWLEDASETPSDGAEGNEPDGSNQEPTTGETGTDTAPGSPTDGGDG